MLKQRGGACRLAERRLMTHMGPVGGVAQRLEPTAHNSLVAGSNPAAPTIGTIRKSSAQSFGWLQLR